MEMIRDAERVDRCRLAIEQAVEPHHIFCELGCGTGIFTIHAARICRKVVAVEIDDRIIEVAKRNVAIAGLSSRVEFIQDDALNVNLIEKVDVLFCEMMSIWLINEPQVPVVNHARTNFIREDGIIIPRKVINIAELGNLDYVFDGVDIKASLPQFTGIRPPRIMTESRVVSTIDFSATLPMTVERNVVFDTLVSGILNCVRLSSIVQFVEGVNFFSTDSLMPVTIVPLKNELFAKEGDRINLHVLYKHRSNLDDSIFEGEIVGY
jgi:predicted RNA methylase